MKYVYHLVDAYDGTITDHLAVDCHRTEARKQARAWIASQLAVSGPRTLSAVEQPPGTDVVKVLETARYVAGDETAGKRAPVITESLYVWGQA